MSKILELSPHVADLIAAGEVVERPASVVKELMENAIDAGATVLTVEIKNGGMSYIRVTDNGSGIAPEDAETAFLRHATSKLRDARGLESIATLGFRGEALAAISAVSRITLLTRERGAAEGISLSLEAGTVVQRMPAGCPEGTTMTVCDLFFNTPARLKFVKTDRAEGAAVTAALISCALSHPEVSVKYIKDGKEECHTPGDGRVVSCVYSLFGRDFSAGLLEARSDGEEVSAEGYVCSPAAARGNRSYQYFFVNGRHVKSRTLQAALEQAYKNCLFTGRFPSCVLYITVSHGAVDVNVHPAKTEIKFRDEKSAFNAVYYAALSALESETKKPEIQVSEGTRAVVSAPQVQAPANTSAPAPEVRRIEADAQTQIKSDRFWDTMPAEKFRSAYSSGGGRGFVSRAPSAKETARDLPVRDETLAAYRSSYVPAKPAPDKAYRYIGEALNTYLIVEWENSIWLIDKHAAHERVNFDRLREQRTGIMSETLLTPIVMQIGAEDAAAVSENTSLFEELGFSVDMFGETSVAIRAIPSIIRQEEAESAVSEMCRSLRAGGDANLESARDELLHTIACKAAIKAGSATESGELPGLIEKVLSGEVKYCPHGRPVAVELTKAQLDKGFKRA